MIKLHPMVDDSNFERQIQAELNNSDPTGYVSMKTLKLLFNLFSWVYIEGNIVNAFYERNSELENFLNRFDLFRFKGDSLCYSTVLFYQKLKRVINLRDLNDGIIGQYRPGDNKLLSSEDFNYEELYTLYQEGVGDISSNLLLFNELFSSDLKKDIRKITSYGEVVRASSMSDLVRPDFSYKLATRQLDVNKDLEIPDYADKKLYVLQDSTQSMQNYIPYIKALKAYILNEAFKNDYDVEWLYVSDKINDRAYYSKNYMKSMDIVFTFGGTKVDTSKILTSEEFVGKKVVIITDGTDSFNFPFNTKTKSINVISFKDNINIRNKISTYGRFFKVKLGG